MPFRAVPEPEYPSLMSRATEPVRGGQRIPLVIQGDQSQYRLGGEGGPCLTAWATERTVIVGNAEADDRWPLWTESARELQIASVISVPPLIRGTKCLGAMKLYAAAPDAYNLTTARPLEKLAASAAILLDNIQSSDTPKRFSEGLVEALISRDAISRAQGVPHGPTGNDRRGCGPGTAEHVPSVEAVPGFRQRRDPQRREE